MKTRIEVVPKQKVNKKFVKGFLKNKLCSSMDYSSVNFFWFKKPQYFKNGALFSLMFINDKPIGLVILNFNIEYFLSQKRRPKLFKACQTGEKNAALISMYVKPQYRSKGYTKLMLKHLDTFIHKDIKFKGSLIIFCDGDALNISKKYLKRYDIRPWFGS